MRILQRRLVAILCVFFAHVAMADWERVTVVDSNVHNRSKTQVQLVGLDQFGQVQYTSRSTPVRRQMNFARVPADVVTLQLEYRARSGELLATFSTSVNLESPVKIIDPPMVDPNDPVVTAFAFMGCNRVADGAGSENLPSTANVSNLIQDFAEIPDPIIHSPVPTHLMFVGDLVVNHVPGLTTLTSQLEGWKAVYATTPLSTSDVELVTIAGNHEMLQKVKQDGVSVEIQNPLAGEVFAAIMADSIPASNGPTQAPPNLDGVARDESKLSFSFQFENLFFILLDTDTYTGDDSPDGIGFVPLHWLQEQLLTAQNDASIEHVFVFGHKPIEGEEGVGETIAPSQLDMFTSMLCDPTSGEEATKVRGYFAAHAHYWRQTLVDCPTSENMLQQVISGNGGTSPEQAFFMPPHGFFGYTVVGIKQSGAVELESWGRFVTSPDDAPNQAQTTLREHRTITQLSPDSADYSHEEKKY